MGLFAVRVEVFSIHDAQKARVLEFIVDTGATLSVIPQDVAEELGVQPEEKRIFQLANGSHVARDIGSVGFGYEGRRTVSSVVIGQHGDVPLLGAVVLESWGFEADPVHKTLRPSQMYLLHVGAAKAAAAPS